MTLAANAPISVSAKADYPEGWVGAPLMELCFIIRGVSYKRGEELSDHKVGYVPLLRANNIDGSINFDDIRYVPAERVSGEQRLRIGDVVIAMSSGSKSVVGKAATLRLEWTGTFGAFCGVLRPNPTVDWRYFGLYFQSRDYRDRISESSAGVNINNLKRSSFEQLVFPLPPLDEQKRVVAKVEELLARVNAARERLQRVPAILKRFRQAVLAAACSGRLTDDWRRTHPDLLTAKELLAPTQLAPKRRKRAGRLWGAGIVPELTDEEKESIPHTWTWTKVRALGTDQQETVQVGPMSMRSRDFAESGVPVLNVGCVQWGYFDESKLDFMPVKIADTFPRYKIAKNDILFTRSGTVGRCSVAGDKQDGYLMTFHLLRVRPSPAKCLPSYLQFVFQGAPHIRRQTEEGAIGSTRAGFNTNLLADLDVPLAPLVEQHEIVRRVEGLFNLADAIEKRVAAAIAHADKLTQSILAKAFRGELVPTEAELARREGRSYEPASVLLERLKATAQSFPTRPRHPSGKGGKK